MNRNLGRTWLNLLGIVALLALGVAIGRTPRVQAQAPAICPPPLAPKEGVDYDAGLTIISFSNTCGQSVPLGVDIASDDARQASGLMNIAPLPDDQGELFDFASTANGAPVLISFWMKDTEIPLSIAFISKDGAVQEIQDMQAESLDLHTPQQPYLYAVEANQGWFAQNGIAVGSHADLAPALALTGPTGS